MNKRDRKRLERQIDALARPSPKLRRLVAVIRGRPGIFLRLPLGLALILGGFLAVLPVFGLWMIPLGLLILALDVPPLRPAVLSLVVLLRRKWRQWRGNGGNGRPSG